MVQPRRCKRVYWACVLVAVVLFVGGAAIAYLGYAETGGPDGAVRGYFDAIARSNAPDALAFGDVPTGPHRLLTSTVLREQQQIAPMRHFAVESTSRNGSKASVTVRYTLAFPGDDEPVTSTVPVVQKDGDWRLTQAAIPTQLSVTKAAQRATILGTQVPEDTALLFPGAVPIRFDTPYLQLDPTQDSVAFGANPTTLVDVMASREGEKQAVSAVSAVLKACLAGHGDVRCPQPSERFVPGSLRGTVAAPLDRLAVSVESGAAGVLGVTGSVRVTGTYRRLDFENRAAAGHGNVTLPIHARSYAVPPLAIAWTRP
jgi:hypothetical protein